MEPKVKTTTDWIQEIIWKMELSQGPSLLKISGLLLAFVLVGVWFNVRGGHSFSSPEAMESAHLGRHLAAWEGYTTYSIRPAAVGLLLRADPSRAAEMLRHPLPDLSVAPGYPFALACLMKVLPFNFTANPTRLWPYQPEILIIGFNDLLFLLSAFLLFLVARRLFDAEVAWVAAIVFAGSEIYWKFSLSGLSTMWLLLLFLMVSWCLLAMDERERREIPPPQGTSMFLATVTGVLVGVGGLSRYSFAWLVLPVLLFIVIFLKRHRLKLALLAAVSFLLVMAPWIARNLALSHTPFGTAGYALLENTRPYEEDRLERALDPYGAGLSHLSAHDVINKFLANEGKTLKSDLPCLGGNWVWSFFLCSLLLPIKNEGLRRLRWFLIWALALMAVVQPLGQTHLSVDSPEINSENLLILLAPLVLVFGTAFFFTLLDQIEFAVPKLRRLAAALFAVVMCAPFLLDLVAPRDQAAVSPYSPYHIQTTAALMHPDELMMSDIPWAIAWYGNRRCAWLTLSDSTSFNELYSLEPIHAIYLTQRTTDRPLLTQVAGNPHSWERFVFNSLPESVWPLGTVPADFPLTNAPPGYRPGQLFISDSIRWNNTAKR